MPCAAPACAYQYFLQFQSKQKSTKCYFDQRFIHFTPPDELSIYHTVPYHIQCPISVSLDFPIPTSPVPISIMPCQAFNHKMRLYQPHVLHCCLGFTFLFTARQSWYWAWHFLAALEGVLSPKPHFAVNWLMPSKRLAASPRLNRPLEPCWQPCW